MHLTCFLVARLPVQLLVEDRVEREHGLAGLPVTDDQLALATADRRHGVDGLPASPSGSFTGCRCTTDGAWTSSARSASAAIGPESVDRLAQGLTTRPRKPSPTGTEHPAGAPHLLALLDVGGVAEQHAADLAHIQVECQTQQATLELQQLVRHRRVQALHTRDPVARLGARARPLPARSRVQTLRRCGRSPRESPPARSSTQPCAASQSRARQSRRAGDVVSW